MFVHYKYANEISRGYGHRDVPPSILSPSRMVSLQALIPAAGHHVSAHSAVLPCVGLHQD